MWNQGILIARADKVADVSLLKWDIASQPKISNYDLNAEVVVRLTKVAGKEYIIRTR
jgi:hypothetical protein